MTSNVVVQNITPPAQSINAMQQQRVLHNASLRHTGNASAPGLQSQHIYDNTAGNGMVRPQSNTGSSGGGMSLITGKPQNYQNMMATGGGPNHGNYGSYAQQQTAQQIHIRQMYGQQSGAVRASSLSGSSESHNPSMGRTNIMVNGGGSAASTAVRNIRQTHPGKKLICYKKLIVFYYFFLILAMIINANQPNQRPMMMINQPGSQSSMQYDQNVYSIGNGLTGMNTGSGLPQRQLSLNDSYNSMNSCIGMQQQSNVPSGSSQVLPSHIHGNAQQSSGGISHSMSQMQGQRVPPGFVAIPSASVPNQVNFIF